MACLGFIGDPLFSLAEIKEAAKIGGLLALDFDLTPESRGSDKPRPPSQETLSFQDICNIVEQAAKFGAKQIALRGDNVFGSSHLPALLTFLADRDLSTSIYTSGVHLTEALAERLSSQGIHVGLTADDSDAVDLLLAAGFGGEGIPLARCMDFSHMRTGEWEKEWRALRSRGIKPLFSLPSAGLSVDEVAAAEGVFSQLAQVDRDEFGIEWNPQPPIAGEPYLRDHFSCLVDMAGEVRPCCGLDLVVGNIRESSLKQIINDSEVLQDIRNHTEEIKGPCGECPKIDHCCGSREAAYANTGDYMASDPYCWLNASRRDEVDVLPVDVEPLIPHRGPMKLVGRLLHVGERTAVVETTLRDEMLFVGSDGAVDRSAYLEIIAQASAAHNGFRLRHKESKPEGFLLGARKLKILGDARAGDTLTVSVFKEAKLGDFGIIIGEIHNGDTCVARGEIKVYHKSMEETS